MSLPSSNAPSRAYPPPTHLSPPSFPPALCPTCTSHATLHSNLLAAYLPPLSSSGYTTALANEQAYRERLDERYPLVCARCETHVDEALRKAAYRSRTAVLSGFLRPSTASRLASSPDRREPDGTDGAHASALALRVVWQAKRALWLGSLALSLTVALSRASPSLLPLARSSSPPPLPSLRSTDIHPAYLPSRAASALPSPTVLLALQLASLVWIFWDPTWSGPPSSADTPSTSNGQLGPRARSRPGRRAWVALMGVLWAVRVGTAAYGVAEWGGWVSEAGRGRWTAVLACEVFVRPPPLSSSSLLLLARIFNSNPPPLLPASKIPLAGTALLFLAAHTAARRAPLRTINLVRPSSLSLPRAPAQAPTTTATGSTEGGWMHAPLPTVQPVFGQTGFAAARAAGAGAGASAGLTAGAEREGGDGRAVEAMDVDDDDDGVGGVGRLYPGPPTLAGCFSSDDDDDDGRPPARPALVDAAAETATDDWQAFLRPPRAFGHPTGVVEVEPGGAVERLFGEWTIDDRGSSGYGRPGGRGEGEGDREKEGWLGRWGRGWGARKVE